MATPIGHALAGYAVYQLRPVATSEGGRERALLWLCVSMAIAPDLDFLPGMLQGHPNLYHQGISHSIGAACVVSGLTAVLLGLRNGVVWSEWGLLFLAYASHLAVDFWGPDSRPPYGQPLFWPVSGAYYLAPTPILMGVRHAKNVAATPGEWIAGVLHPQNLAAVGVEILVMAPVILLTRSVRRLRLALQGRERDGGEKPRRVA
ncbi:MAG: metal-dependent hydrolase [Thermodesulfobacteriota bacterium]